MQKMKLETWTQAVVREIGGPNLHDCVVLPTEGTRGGAAIFWDKNLVVVTSQAISHFSITAKVTVVSSATSFFLTTVYGPSDDTNKADFLVELVRFAPPLGSPWLLNGDFNVIYEARDKNNLNLNRRIMSRFRAAIDTAALEEIKCKNRRFTWSSERESPTLVSIESSLQIQNGRPSSPPTCSWQRQPHVQITVPWSLQVPLHLHGVRGFDLKASG